MTRAADALADCIDEFLKGGAELKTQLAKHPEYREEIEELLGILARIGGLPDDVCPDQHWVRQTRAAIEGRTHASRG